MRPFRQILGAVFAVGAALWVSGCAPVHVHASLERGMEFTRYSSYAWAPDKDFNTGDPRLDNNELFQSRIRNDVDRGLASYGFEKATPSTADLMIHYHANTTEKIDVNELDYHYGYSENSHSSVYDAGTITLDLVDARTKRLVWRGWSEGSFDGIDSQAIIEARVDEAVAKILERLPPRR
jgi:hypothetical protein